MKGSVGSQKDCKNGIRETNGFCSDSGNTGVKILKIIAKILNRPNQKAHIPAIGRRLYRRMLAETKF